MDKFRPNQIHHSKFAETILSDVRQRLPHLILNTSIIDFNSCLKSIKMVAAMHRAKLAQLAKQRITDGFDDISIPDEQIELPKLISLATDRVNRWQYRSLTATKMVKYYKKYHSEETTKAHFVSLLQKQEEADQRLTKAKQAKQDLSDRLLNNQLHDDVTLKQNQMAHITKHFSALITRIRKAKTKAMQYHFNQLIKLSHQLDMTINTINQKLRIAGYAINQVGSIRLVSDDGADDLSSLDKSIIVATYFAAPDVIFWTTQPVKHPRIVSIVQT